ncbi:GGDEF domain-containing protein [Microaerobacter geothermalis]|uniref:GGDEF domain-containing protein n=1 Tax=Microaerobacter geothermalis TaxID=674972 RepID=UPI001F307B3B|nr:GGDEF domain-containing protein [Microaerobacter geothermalis]MCF6094951.1 GGDEF domain-containing protein [Microaerobacter geothermalis]
MRMWKDVKGWKVFVSTIVAIITSILLAGMKNEIVFLFLPIIIFISANYGRRGGELGGLIMGFLWILTDEMFIRKGTSEISWMEWAINILFMVGIGAWLGIVHEQIKHLKVTDVLTQVYNRGYFLDILKKEFSHCQKNEYPLSLIMIDIDNFKKVNDTYGHQFGDVVLQQFSDLLKNELYPNRFIGRYGGEEFAVILPRTDSKEAYHLAELLRIKTGNQLFNGIKITISSGISTLHHHEPISVDHLIQQADKALYQAKHSGRNLTCVIDSVISISNTQIN